MTKVDRKIQEKTNQNKKVFFRNKQEQIDNQLVARCKRANIVGCSGYIFPRFDLSSMCNGIRYDGRYLGPHVVNKDIIVPKVTVSNKPKKKKGKKKHENRKKKHLRRRNSGDSSAVRTNGKREGSQRRKRRTSSS